MGQLRFLTTGSKSSKSGMERIGSKPRLEIGGSVVGEAHNLIRPSRLASINASSVTEPFPSTKWNMNYIKGI